MCKELDTTEWLSTCTHMHILHNGILVLGWEDPLEEEMTTHSSMLAWKIPRTEEPGRLQSMVSQRVRHNRATEHTQKILKGLLYGPVWWITDRSPWESAPSQLLLDSFSSISDFFLIFNRKSLPTKHKFSFVKSHSNWQLVHLPRCVEGDADGNQALVLMANVLKARLPVMSSPHTLERNRHFQLCMFRVKENPSSFPIKRTGVTTSCKRTAGVH